MKKYALIPAFEPDERLLSLCHELSCEEYSIVVIDDGSGTEYEEIFAQVGKWATVLFHMENLGKGAAIKTGLRYIREAADTDDIVVTVDADGQHKIADVNKVAQAAELEHGVLVLGSRSFSGDIPLKSKLGNKITRVIYRAIAHQSIADTQTGLRAFSYDLIPFFIEIQGERYEYEMNVLLKCSRDGVPISELPIETVYIDGNASSHFRAFRDALRIYWELFRFSASSFASFILDYAMFGILSRALISMGSGAVPLANILARFISATANFYINRKYVFHDCGNWFSSVLKYGALAVSILAGNTFLLVLLTTVLGLNRYIAKLLTETLFFLMSWQIQSRFVFTKR
jgi:glycosyltransferase involved in cell wall biosynthesis